MSKETTKELLDQADQIAEEESAKAVEELQEALGSETETEEVREYLPGEGPVEFFSDNGRFFLGQGEVAVDITDVLHMVNHPMGRVSLNLRLSNHKQKNPGNKAWNWMIESMRGQNVKEDKHGYEYPKDGD